jgi:broad specificity phosphatase PhoE
MATIHILRHGQSLHNVQRGYPHRDPPLTELGSQQANNVRLLTEPSLILVSPMTRTIQTALIVFGHLINTSPAKAELQVWPDLREAHDAICNKGVSRTELAAKFPQVDLSACHEEWDYPPHNPDDAIVRAESVRYRLKELSHSYNNIVLILHRGFIAFLVQGDRFNVCGTVIPLFLFPFIGQACSLTDYEFSCTIEYRSYRFATMEELGQERFGINYDTGSRQDYGPSLLLPNSPLPTKTLGNEKLIIDGKKEIVIP